MKKINQPKGLTGFQLSISAFCLPILLWPLAIFLSPHLTKNQQLAEWQIIVFSIFLWIYPLILALNARFLYKLHQADSQRAGKCLWISAIIFYSILISIIHIGFING
ncbi:DUF5389 family protein [Rodentibacter caecimuris]|uniref:Aspartate-semialdehyde dehydrogenase n=1 Tax=Rodentibacter caecimuris TaxID=1796644 RepID=A0ABX3KYF1_9PAST|nr:hypothetical protein BKG89_09090 [Rodentibacter heylii]